MIITKTTNSTHKLAIQLRQQVKIGAGFTLIEVLVGLAIFVIIVVSVYGSVTVANKAVNKAGERRQAAFLLEEGVEAVRRMRDVGWDTNIKDRVLGDEHCLNFDISNKFVLATKPPDCSKIDDTFTRTVKFYSVCRTDESGKKSDIVQCPGVSTDSDIKKVTVTVTWKGYTESVDFYLANLFKN